MHLRVRLVWSLGIYIGRSQILTPVTPSFHPSCLVALIDTCPQDHGAGRCRRAGYRPVTVRHAGTQRQVRNWIEVNFKRGGLWSSFAHKTPSYRGLWLCGSGLVRIFCFQVSVQLLGFCYAWVRYAFAPVSNGLPLWSPVSAVGSSGRPYPASRSCRAFSRRVTFRVRRVINYAQYMDELTGSTYYAHDDILYLGEPRRLHRQESQLTTLTVANSGSVINYFHSP